MKTIHQLVRERKFEELEKVLPTLRSCDAQDSKGNTALHIAAEMGLNKIVRLLLKYRAYPNIKNIDGNTPLHLATKNRHYKIVETLLNYNHGNSSLTRAADASIQNNLGNTPIHIAAQNNDLQLVKLFKKYVVNLYTFNIDGKTPKDMATMKEIKDLL